jgi:two-component system response regulator HydG
VPPLRKRTEDIIPFVDFFIAQANKAFLRNVTGFSDAVRELILRYPWYGNIRELQNVINRAVLLTAGSTIEAESLPDEIRFPDLQTNLKQAMANQKKDGIQDLKEATLIKEKEVIANALVKSNYNKSKAAKMLNIDRKTLYNKIKLYQIDTEL